MRTSRLWTPTDDLVTFGRMLPLLLWIFASSGLAGLAYEIVWTRYLALFVGHTAYAQAIVLQTFLGGMAIGAVLVAHRSTRMRHPLRVYAIVEALLGVAGLAFHPVYTWVTEVAYGRLFPALGAGSTVTVVQWGLAAALILPQSILLGMTFPLLSAAVLRRATTAASTGRTIALLKTGNPERAATIFYRRYRNAMSSSDFRMRLLDAHVQRSLAQRR